MYLILRYCDVYDLQPQQFLLFLADLLPTLEKNTLCLAPSDKHQFASIKSLALVKFIDNTKVIYFLGNTIKITEFGGMCVGTIGFQSSGSSPTFGLRRYSAVKSMIG